MGPVHPPRARRARSTKVDPRIDKPYNWTDRRANLKHLPLVMQNPTPSTSFAPLTVDIPPSSRRFCMPHPCLSAASHSSARLSSSRPTCRVWSGKQSTFFACPRSRGGNDHDRWGTNRARRVCVALSSAPTLWVVIVQTNSFEEQRQSVVTRGLCASSGVGTEATPRSCCMLELQHSGC